MFKRYLTKLVSVEVQRVLTDKNYIKQLKESLQDDIVKQRVNENESYLKDMRKDSFTHERLEPETKVPMERLNHEQ